MTTPPATRIDRRKARTRAALIGAAQRIVASGTTTVSIQEITDAADVGFGSFYNHFSSKDELFEEAVAAALDTWGLFRDEIVAGMEDPAEAFATSFRMTGRLQRRYPELVRVVLHTGTSVLLTDRGLRPRARADIERGIEAGRFTLQDPELALMAVGGALLGMLQMLDADPAVDDASVADRFTERVLLLLGLSPEDAAAQVRRELPDLPDLTGPSRGAS